MPSTERIRREAMPHQARYLEWAAGRATPAAFMQMRLGKSLCALRWARTRTACPFKILACPLSVVPSWRAEMAAEGQHFREATGTALQKAEALRDLRGDGRGWLLTNLESLVAPGGRPSEIARFPWDLAAVDESSRMRNPRSGLARVCLSTLSRAPRRTILSGLPNPEGPEGLVTQMIFLRGEFMGCRNFWEWRARHMVPAGFRGWTVKRTSLGEMRSEAHRLAFFMTRAEAGIPDRKVYQTRWVRVSRVIRDALRQADEEFRVGDRMTSSRLATLTWACQLTGGRFPDPSMHHDAKVDEVSDLACGELAGEQVVVWCRFNAEVAAVRSRLRADGLSCESVTGETPLSRRAEIVERFQAGRVRALSVQSKCMQMGVDLSAAGASVVFSNYHDLEVRRQLEDRLVHPARKSPALIVDLVAAGTYDEDVVDTLNDKDADASTFNSRLMARVRRRATDGR